MSDSLTKMSAKVRLALIDVRQPPNRRQCIVTDPWELNQSVQELMTRANLALRRAPSDPTGRERDLPAIDLLLSIGILWRLTFPASGTLR